VISIVYSANLIIGFLIGWLFGSFLNYLADELPVRRRLGRPECGVCQTRFALFNYLVLPRKCEACGSARRSRTWVVEFGMGIGASFLMAFTPPGFGWFGAVILLGFLILVTVIDIEHRLILHMVSLVGCAITLVLGIHLHGVVPTLAGGAVGFGAMLLFYYLGVLFLRFFRHSRSEQIVEEEAIGFGDVILSGVIGLLLGWPGITLGLLLAILIAGAVSLVVVIVNVIQKKYHPDLSVPYGPFLTISAFLLIYIRPLFLR